MTQVKPNSLPALSAPSQTPNPTVLIEFEEQDDTEQFRSDYSSQIYDQEESVISTQTQKKKQEKRDRFTEFISNNRKSLGLPIINKRINYTGQENCNRDIIVQLGDIEGAQKKHGENQQFILTFNKNPEKAIAQYIKSNIIASSSPDDIAAYLITVQGLDKEVLGRYFGENKKNILEILHSYCKLLNFKNIEFDRALRILLLKFRLPGEAQQIERIVWQFSLAFYQINQESYDNADELFPLAYAIIMLGTDAHNPKQQKKMSKQDFVTNTKRACPSITSDYLGNIYDRITTQKFETQISDMENVYARLRDINASDFKSSLKLTNQLKKGDVFLKVCRNTPKFVQRKIYLSDDQLRIQWISDPPRSDSEEPRFIEIKDITDLTLGLGSAIMKKNKVPQEFDPMCFTIETTHRTLDLKAKTNKQRAKWLNYIRAVLIKKREKRIAELENDAKIGLNRDQIEQIWNTEIFPHWDKHWDYKNKKPLVRNVIVRGIQAICCCWKSTPKTSDTLENEGESRGLKIKTTKLQTLWKLGLPSNSRKVLWPLVIGNNLALSTAMIEQIKKRKKHDQNLTKFISFDQQSLEMAQICRQFRPDIPPIRDLLLISSIFSKAISKTQGANSANICLNAYLNLLHLDHFLSFYRTDRGEIQLRAELFQFLLQKNAPKVKDHFKVLKLETRMYLISWFLSVFSDCFNQNQEFLYRIWDNFLLEGENYLFKIGITIIKYYQVELKMCTFHQGLKLLRFPKDTEPILFFQILDNEIDVKQEYFSSYIEMRKHAIIKAKVQAIPLE